MEIYRQALEIEADTDRSFAEIVNLLRKVGYNQTLLILMDAK